MKNLDGNRTTESYFSEWAIELTFTFALSGQNIRISRRSVAAERQEALSCSSALSDRSPPEAPQHSRLKKLLSPTGSREPPTLKLTPPTAAKAAGERSSSVASTASATASSADRAEANSRDGRKKEPATTGHSSRKHRNHKEPSSEVRHQAPSLRSSSSLDHKRPRRKTQPGGREHEKEQVRRNEAARIIQRAWQRWGSYLGWISVMSTCFNCTSHVVPSCVFSLL